MNKYPLRHLLLRHHHMPTTCFSAMHIIELLWNICVMTSACCFPTLWHTVSVIYLNRVFLKPSSCCWLGGSRIPHAECFLWAVFWTENTWTQRLNSSLSYRAASTIKAESACPFVVCRRVRLHSFHLFSKWLHLQLMKWRIEVNTETFVLLSSAEVQNMMPLCFELGTLLFPPVLEPYKIT